ncbi:DUF488 family protein [Orbaceae bacterium ESL0721]|nr:DUF488 family protein [Orbaceae bacterium ESL0721]
MSYEIQRVYSYKGEKPAALVDRLWPRGVSKKKLAGVERVKDVAPSTELREWFHQDRANRYPEFCKRYYEELQQPDKQAPLDELRKMEHKDGKLTLLTASKDINHCHVPVLVKVLKRES